MATGVSFINHDITSFMFFYTDTEHEHIGRYGEITIGDNVFVGANSTILYDVKLGNNCIIGAGSLVNRDIPDGSVALGVPCREVGKFEDYQRKIKKK